MTNTKITDPEELESRYPVQLEKFEIRKKFEVKVALKEVTASSGKLNSIQR